MIKIIDLLKSEIKVFWIHRICSKTWLWAVSINTALEAWKKPIKKSTLDALYDYFDIDYDDYYLKNLKALNRGDNCLFGDLLRNKRIARGMSSETLVKYMWIWERTLSAIELWESIPKLRIRNKIYTHLGYTKDEVAACEIFVDWVDKMKVCISETEDPTHYINNLK